MSDFVTESVVWRWRGVSMEETSANPHQRVFLTLWVCNYEACVLYASHLGKNVWENHVFKKWEKENPTGRRDLFGQHSKREKRSISARSMLTKQLLLSQHTEKQTFLFKSWIVTTFESLTGSLKWVLASQKWSSGGQDVPSVWSSVLKWLHIPHYATTLNLSSEACGSNSYYFQILHLQSGSSWKFKS